MNISFLDGNKEERAWITGLMPSNNAMTILRENLRKYPYALVNLERY